jgi:hypothetical protein
MFNSKKFYYLVSSIKVKLFNFRIKYTNYPRNTLQYKYDHKKFSKAYTNASSVPRFSSHIRFYNL